jgi:hypothetical protein
MERTTKADIDNVFGFLCKDLGVPKGHGHGEWYVDHNPTYGGCIVERVDDHCSGVSHPLVSRRLPPGEFVRAMHFAISALAWSKGRRS